MTTKINASDFDALIRGSSGLGSALDFVTEAMDSDYARVKLRCHDNYLRPGPAIAGPILMALADVALFASVLSRRGGDLRIVTTDMQVNFLRRAHPQDVVAEARLIRCGRRRAVAQCFMWQDDPEKWIFQATGSFALPVEESPLGPSKT